MKLSIKNTFRNLVIAALGAAVLSACGGAGSCTTCSSNSTANTGSLDKLSMVAPSSYPAAIAVTVPVVVTNNGTETINNLNYTIDAASNTTGGTITIQAASAASCRIIAAKASCTLNAEIAASPASHPGSFSIATSQGAAKSGLRAFFTSSVLSVNVNVGLVQMPTNTSSGADGLTLYYPSAIVGTATNGITQVIVTAVVTSANAGTFNTIQLVDGNGNPLNYSVISGSSGTGMTNLAYGSVVSFLVTVPSGSSQVQFKAQTAANGTVVSTSANSNTILVTNPATPTGIMSVSPNYFNLTPNNESQIITLSNSGNGAVSSLSFTATSPLTELSNTCGTTLAAGATCQYVVKFNKDIPKAGTSGVTVNYNNGSTSQSATATVNYTGVDPIAGLTITSDNPNFDFTTRTSTPSQTSLVTLTNSGNSDESGFSFSPVTYFTTNTTGVVNPCSVSTILAPGASCSVNLVYNNSTAIGVTTDVIPVSYKYGQTAGTASSSIHVTYNTIQSVAILAITPNPTNFTGIVNNGVDNNTQTLSVTNSGDATATLTNNVISGSNAALFSLPTNTAPTPCGATLAASSSCNLMVKFGPSSAAEAASSKNASLDINYIPYTGATATSTSGSLIGQVSGAQSAIIAAEQTITSGFTSGDGTQFNSYQIAQGASAATITYVITNTGTVPANSFYVSGLASSGWSYSGCGANGVPVILAANSGTCTLTFTLNTATAAARNLDLSTLTMNWVDQDSPAPAGQTQPMTGTVYANVYGVPIYGTAVLSVNPTSVLVNATSTATITVTGANNYAGSQTFSVASSDVSIATVPPSASCTISDPSSVTNTCTVTITGVAAGTSNISATNANYTIVPVIVTVTAPTPSQAQLLLAPGSDYSCMLNPTNSIAYCWGYNTNGELGNGTNNNSGTPTSVATGGLSAIPSGTKLIAISAGTSNNGGGMSCAITAAGKLYCWGDNHNGALGNGLKSPQSNPYPIAVATGGSSAIPTNAVITYVTSNNVTSCAIDSNGDAYCWGLGALGNGTSNNPYPVKVTKGGSSAIPLGDKLIAISSSGVNQCVVDEIGNAYCWGTGYVGNGTMNALYPVLVTKGGSSAIPSGAAITQISVSKDNNSSLNTTCVVAESLGYCWGYNGTGAFGNGNTANSTYAVAIATGGSSSIPIGGVFSVVATGDQQSCAVVNGLGYCWGNNSRGQLGNNSTSSSLWPTTVLAGGSSAIPTNITLQNIGTAYDNGISNGLSSCSLGSDNNLYCWGDNTYGELGIGVIGTPPYSTVAVKVLIP
jgi:alpha-tubulin suppressor-like RCC1 family protein